MEKYTPIYIYIEFHTVCFFWSSKERESIPSNLGTPLPKVNFFGEDSGSIL